MTEELNIDNYLSDEEKYKALLFQIEHLLKSDEPVISNISNFTAALKQTFSKISWVGFYLLKEGKLFLGPFQGKIACTIIELGKGVCGTSAVRAETIIVEDVDKFPGHIACDSGSKSEIVVPLIADGNVLGVLDLDSFEFNSFDEIDKLYLEKLTGILLNKIKLNEKILY